jgi:hypothetical protein
MATTPIPNPSLDQPVHYMSESGTPLAATVVHLWEDGPVDIVVTDPAVAQEFKVTRIPYVPFGGTNTPLTPDDPRYAAQLNTGV